MIRRVLIVALAGLILIGGLGFAGWLASLPGAVAATPEPVPESETAQTIERLRPPKRERPLVAVIGINDATETTDYLMPTGILRRSGVADVLLVATEPGPVRLFPALSVEPDLDIAAFDAAHPDGADYVIVPAMSRDDDPVVLDWLRRQAEKGSIVIGVCAGAKVVAAAGLLEGRRGTTHWFYLKRMLELDPSIQYVADRRFVVDGRIVTTTGISASMPIALTLIEAIAGRERAEAVAAEIGLSTWDARHDSDAFRLTRPFVTTIMGNVLQFWAREEFILPIGPDYDAVSLALVADAWSRTYRSRVVTLADREGPLSDRDDIRIIPDRIGAAGNEDNQIVPPGRMAPALALGGALDSIGDHYGTQSAAVVAMQLEYAGPQ